MALAVLAWISPDKLSKAARAPAAERLRIWFCNAAPAGPLLDKAEAVPRWLPVAATSAKDVWLRLTARSTSLPLYTSDESRNTVSGRFTALNVPLTPPPAVISAYVVLPVNGARLLTCTLPARVAVPPTTNGVTVAEFTVSASRPSGALVRLPATRRLSPFAPEITTPWLTTEPTLPLPLKAAPLDTVICPPKFVGASPTCNRPCSTSTVPLNG